MKFIFFLLVFVICLFSKKSPNFLISDYDFTNQNYTDEDVFKFYKSYSNNNFTDDQIKYIITQGRLTSLHFLIPAVKFEQENSLTRNIYSNNYSKRLARGMAYGLYKKIKNQKTGKYYCPFIGFEIQVTNSLNLLRTKFDEWTPRAKINLIQNNGIIYPTNAATYSIYTFCPIYGKYTNCEKICTGNELFVFLYKMFKKQWKTIK